MATFPTGIPIKSIDLIPKWNTTSWTYDNASETRRQKWSFAKYDVDIDFYPMTKTNMQTLWAFYMARKGAFEAFYIYDITTMAHTDLYIGLGDGSTVTYDLPGKSTSSQTIYVDNVAQTNSVTVFYSYDSGAESSDQVVFSSAPSIGSVLTCDFTGFLRIKCRFAGDSLTRANLYGDVYQLSIKLQGLEL